MPRRLFVEVVLDEQATIVFDAGHQFEQLQLHEAALDAELDDVELDLGRDAPHHLGALQHRDHVAQRDEVFDLERGQRRAHLVEAMAVALECLQRLVGAEHDVGRRLQDALWSRSRRR